MIGHSAAVDHAADDIVLINLFHRHLDQSVVHQNAHTHF